MSEGAGEATVGPALGGGAASLVASEDGRASAAAPIATSTTTRISIERLLRRVAEGDMEAKGTAGVRGRRDAVRPVGRPAYTAPWPC